MLFTKLSQKNSHVLLKTSLDVLKHGGILVHPTETCYGLAVDIFNEKALKRLYRLKRMKMSKPLSILVSSFREAKKYGVFSLLAQKVAKKFWPGAVTIMVPKNEKNLPGFFNQTVQTVGMRVPGHRWTLQLLKKYKRPLATTSANLSGDETCYQIEDFLKQIKKNRLQPDLVIDAGLLPVNLPSTLVLIEGKKMKILRKGGLERLVREYVKKCQN